MGNGPRASRVLCIYGNPKRGGFVHGCVDHVAARLGAGGIQIDRLRLAESAIRDCAGCFQCPRTGSCPIDDDVPEIIERIRRADGMVVGASVRNGYFPALFKRFFERITYILGFGRELGGKYVLAIGAVGLAEGKKHLGRLITFRQFHTYVSDYLFFRVGLPTKRSPEDVAARLDASADAFGRAIATAAPLPLAARIQRRIDDFLIRRFMLEKNPEGAFDYVIERWKAGGLM